MDLQIKQKVLAAQRNELTESLIYRRLAAVVNKEQHKNILERISREEESHARILRSITGQEVSPDFWRVHAYVFISKVFGLNFGLRLMERGEDLAQDVYESLKDNYPGIETLFKDEQEHEKKLIDMIDEERLQYIGAVVLGLNDALVELTGVLAGLTLALQNLKLIAVAGTITGIAASLSMAASSYLSVKQDPGGKDPLKSAVYTGSAYIATVLFLIWPYLVMTHMFAALAMSLFNVIVIIAVATFYIAVAKGVSFRKRFLEMAGLSLTVAAINFGVGLLIRKVFGIDV